MYKRMTGTTRRRLAATGMVALLFVAGLAFSVFENTSLPRLMASIGIGEQDEVIAAPTDPSLDPDDCLFEPDALRDLVAVPHRSGDTDETGSGLPANHPGAAASPGLAVDDDGTESAGTPGGSPEGSDGSQDGSGGSPSEGATDDDGDAPRRSPHERNYESPCPGR
jgi:hypothetical protein